MPPGSGGSVDGMCIEIYLCSNLMKSLNYLPLAPQAAACFSWIGWVSLINILGLTGFKSLFQLMWLVGVSFVNILGAHLVFITFFHSLGLVGSALLIC